MKLAIYNPLREKDVFDGEQTESVRPDRTAARRCASRGSGWARTTAATTDALYSEPGTYYVSVAADDRGSNLEADQFDTLLDLQVTGEIIPDADADRDARGGRDGGARATPPASARAAAATAAAGELGMAIVLGLALGGLVGFGVRRLRAA